MSVSNEKTKMLVFKMRHTVCSSTQHSVRPKYNRNIYYIAPIRCRIFGIRLTTKMQKNKELELELEIISVTKLYFLGQLDEIARETFNLVLKTTVLESSTSNVEGKNIVIVTFRLDFDNVNYVSIELLLKIQCMNSFLSSNSHWLSIKWKWSAPFH